MTKYITILFVLTASAVFADNETFTGDLSGKSFIGESHKNSVWDGVTAKGTEFSRYTSEYDTTYNSDYTNASFKNADLTNASFEGAIMNDVDFTDAIIKGASFKNAQMNDMAILTKTKSYKEKDLSGVNLGINAFKITKIAIYDFSGFNLTGARLCANLYNPDNPYYTNPDGLFKYDDAIILGADMTKIWFQKEQLCSTKSYKDKILDGISISDTDLSGVDFSGVSLKNTYFGYINLENANFSGANLSGAKFLSLNQHSSRLNVWSTKNALFFNANLTNTDFSECVLENVDFRGANMASITGSPTYKNTIMSDGVIKNFQMNSVSDYLKIRKYEPVSSGNPMISAKVSEADAVVSGGAKFELDVGAVLEVVNNRVLSIKDAGELIINTDLAGSTSLSVSGGAGLSFGEGGKLIVNLTESITGEDAYSFAVVSWFDDSKMSGLSDFVIRENLILTVQGENYAGAWNYIINGNSLVINLGAVPEPAMYAAIFGAVVLAFIMWRKRR